MGGPPERFDPSLGSGIDGLVVAHQRRELELTQDDGYIAVDHARNRLRDERMMLDAFAELARRQRTLLVGTVAPAPVWHLTALADAPQRVQDIYDWVCAQ